MTITAPAIPATGVAIANPTGQQISLTVTGGTVQGILVFPAITPLITTPAIPASTVTATNTNPFPVAVQVNGGTVTAIAVNGSNQATSSPFQAVVPPGGTIAITYSVVPTSWVWTPLVAGVAGSPVSSPSSIIVPPGCTVELNYTVAPSWTWANPICEGYSPGYYGTNSQANVNYNTQIPYPPHNQLGQGNLAAAISN